MYRNAIRTVNVILVSLVSACATTASLGATATFTPVGPTDVESGVDVVFDVTVSVATLALFNTADVLIGSNTANDIAFAYSTPWTTAFASTTSPFFDTGIYAQDVLVGGFNPTPVGSTMFLGTVTLDTAGMSIGAHSVSIDNSTDGISTLGLAGVPEALSGSGTFNITGTGPNPLPAAYPHDRRKNRYISFDPNKTVNDGINVAFKVELKGINMGSCNDGTGGNVDFCRIDRGAADCNSCVGGAGGTCITTAIHCSTGGGVCTPTGATCVNNLPNSGGSNVGEIWWVGPEHPSAAGVHLLVSAPFRKESTNWPNPTHAGDCEVVPQAVYGIRTVDVAGATESNELLVETTKFTPVPGNDPFWWADAIGALVFHCDGDINLPTCTVATQVADCGAGIPCQRAWTLPNGSVNFDDVNAALTLVAPPGVGVPAEKTWVDLHPVGTDAPPNSIMNSADLQQFIFGFGGFPYTGYDPKDCPDVGVWP